MKYTPEELSKLREGLEAISMDEFGENLIIIESSLDFETTKDIYA